MIFASEYITEGLVCVFCVLVKYSIHIIFFRFILIFSYGL